MIDIALKQQSVPDNNEKRTSQFKNEIQALTEIADAKKQFLGEGENLITYYGYIKPKDSLLSDHEYFAMEYVDNGSLQHWISTSAPSSTNFSYWKDALPIKVKILQGLAFLHELNWVHCDLKPENILLTATLEPKICDFGLSVKEGTILKGPIGTPIYMAPEMLVKINGPAEKSSDIFSLGLIYWSMVSKKDPVETINNMDQLIATRVNANEREIMPQHCLPKIAHLIESFWQHDPSKRPTAKNALPELENVLNAINKL